MESVERAGERHLEEIEELEEKIKVFKIENSALSKKELQKQVKAMRDLLFDSHFQQLNDLMYGSHPSPTTPTLASLTLALSTAQIKQVSFPDNPLLPDPQPPTNPTPQKKSKAKQRQEKKLESIGQARVDAGREAALMPDLKLEETVALTSQLLALGLKIYPVKADGHCLFYAISHQLLLLHSKSILVHELRVMVADYMLAHPDTFLPFLVNAQGDCMSTEEYSVYCEEIRDTAKWGGQHEIIAMCTVLGVQITVFQAGMDLLEFGEDIKAGGEASRPLLISYHRHAFGLGEHYNSVISI